MPSCHACIWAEKLNDHENPFLAAIQCKHHDIKIFFPYQNFCSELTGKYQGWFEGLMERLEAKFPLKIQPNRIYTWLEFRDYSHEVVDLASVETYGTWDREYALSVTKDHHQRHQAKIDAEQE